MFLCVVNDCTLWSTNFIFVLEHSFERPIINVGYIKIVVENAWFLIIYLCDLCLISYTQNS